MSDLDAVQALLSARSSFRRGEISQALTLYEQAATSCSLGGLPALRYGSCRLLTGDVGGAVDIFSKAALIDPSDLALKTHLACAMEMQGREAEAAKLYREVIAASPVAGIAYVNLGYLMFVRGNASGAYDALVRGMDAPPAYGTRYLLLPTFKVADLPAPSGGPTDSLASDVCVLLGLKLQESGRFGEAKACLAHALRLNRRNGSAYSTLVRSDRIAVSDAPLVNQMVRLSKLQDLDQQNRTRLFYALAKAMDDLGEYETAIGYIDEAHRTDRPDGVPPFDHSAYEAEIGAIIESYANEPGGCASESDLPILIVGMMRSGTTLVEQILSSHPEASGGDELTFWRDYGSRRQRSDARYPDEEEATDLANAYLRLLRGIDPDGQRVTDKMPHNFLAIGLVHRLFPNARIICCRRNPIDTCLSIAMTDFRHPIPFDNYREGLVLFYRQFERIMDYWRSVIPSDRLMEVGYEELLTHREATTRRLVDFCGLEWDDACLRPEENRRAVKTASAWQVRQSVYSSSSERWRRYEPWLGELRELLT